jgi:DNA-binding CsgD family transcriptional regulator
LAARDNTGKPRLSLAYRTSQAKRALRRIESDDPEEIRAQSVEALLRHSPADFGFFVNYRVRQGKLHHGTFAVREDGVARRTLERLDGTPWISAPCWNPWKPRPIERQRFVSLRHGPVSPEELVRSEGYRLVYEPFGIDDHARILLYEGARFLGWLGLMRSGQRPFEREELAALNQLVPAISAALSAAEDREQGDGEPDLYLMMDPQRLRVQWASHEAEAWLNRRRLGRLIDLVRGLRRGDAPPVTRIESHEVRAVELVGSGAPLYHIHISRAPAPRTDPRQRLSPRQYEVAEAAAAGATNIEIAGALDISRHTVGDHIKAVYYKLGIATRAELASIFAELGRVSLNGRLAVDY